MSWGELGWTGMKRGEEGWVEGWVEVKLRRMSNELLASSVLPRFLPRAHLREPFPPAVMECCGSHYKKRSIILVDTFGWFFVVVISLSFIIYMGFLSVLIHKIKVFFPQSFTSIFRRNSSGRFRFASSTAIKPYSHTFCHRLRLIHVSRDRKLENSLLECKVADICNVK